MWQELRKYVYGLIVGAIFVAGVIAFADQQSTMPPKELVTPMAVDVYKPAVGPTLVRYVDPVTGIAFYVFQEMQGWQDPIQVGPPEPVDNSSDDDDEGGGF